MSNPTTTAPFGSEPARAAPVDLSQSICETVKREPGDIVRCTHIHGDFYRCNWWHCIKLEGSESPGWDGGQLGTSFRVIKSRFLEVTRKDGSLKIEERPARKSYRE